MSDYHGRWLVLLFYPRDFSFVCPTELTVFSARAAEFHERQSELLALSIDTIDMHREWLETSPAAGGIGKLQFPLASDPNGEMARAFGSWSEEKGLATRGLFIIDPQGILQYAVVHSLSVGRNADEVLRVLDALQTGGLCPANWVSADGVLDPEKALAPGRVLGHYRIREKLGSGAFGAVFAAQDERLERSVALKVLRRTLQESRGALLSEARSAAALNHPHICTIYSVDEEDGLPLIVMEYIDGLSLSEFVIRGVDQDSVRRIVYGLVSGLSAAHALGVVHGDLKPANIMVTKEGHAKILDFGLARRRREEVRNTQLVPFSPPTVGHRYSHESGDTIGATSSIRGLAGTPAYMAPEQAMGQVTIPASDVFSLAMVMYEMLTGRRAMAGLHPMEAILRLQRDDFSASLPRDVDETWRDLLTAMLKREPAERPLMSDIAAQVVV